MSHLFRATSLTGKVKLETFLRLENNWLAALLVVLHPIVVQDMLGIV